MNESFLQPRQLIHGMWRLASWNYSVQERLTLIKTCIDHGINTFDHADIYGDYSCEQLFGEAIAYDKSLKNKLFTITKCGIQLLSGKKSDTYVKHYDNSYEHIVKSAENSLQKLQVGIIDLLLLHRPDPLQEPEEIARAFDHLHESGKVKHFGVSNYSAAQFDKLSSFCNKPLITNQIQYSLYHTISLYNGDLDFLKMKKIIPMAWSPLGGGKHPEKESELRMKCDTLLKKYDNITFETLLLAWIFSHPSYICPIIGTGKPERITLLSKSKKVKLEKQDWFQMLEWSEGRPVA